MTAADGRIRRGQCLRRTADELGLIHREREDTTAIRALDDLQHQHARNSTGFGSDGSPWRRYHGWMARRSPYAPPRFDASMRVVVLRGKDAFLVQEYTRRFIATIEEAHGVVERFEFDGDSVQPADVLDELRSYGLLQDHKVVIVDHADQFLAAKGSTGGTGTRRLLERYLESPVESATLLLRAETWKAGKIDKRIAEIGLMHKIDLDDRTDLPFAMKWCNGRTKKAHGASIEDDAAALLLKRIGLDFARLDSELAKLAALVGEDGVISRQHVIEMTGISREEQAWAIQDAVLSGKSERAIRTLRELHEVSRQPAELILWSLVDLLRKLHGTSALIRAGHESGDIVRRQRLFGSSRDRVLQLARAGEPARWSSMLRETLRRQHGIRSGYGRNERTLEGITVRIADTLNTLAAR